MQAGVPASGSLQIKAGGFVHYNIVKYYVQIFSYLQHLTNKGRHQYQFNSLPCVSLCIWEQDWVKKEFQMEVLSLIQQMMENRTQALVVLFKPSVWLYEHNRRKNNLGNNIMPFGVPVKPTFGTLDSVLGPKSVGMSWQIIYLTFLDSNLLKANQILNKANNKAGSYQK